MFGVQEEKAWETNSLLWLEHTKGGKELQQMRQERQGPDHSGLYQPCFKKSEFYLKTVEAIDGFYFYFLIYFIDYAIILVPFFSPLHSPPPCTPPTHQHSPPLDHVRGYKLFSLISPCLFCTYHLCFLFPVPFPPFSLLPLEADNPPCDLHSCSSCLLSSFFF